MKKIVSLLIVLAFSLPMMSGIHTYVENSVMNTTDKWVKIRVSESGVCRMSFSELEQANLNPRQLRVFGYGGAQLEQDFMKRKIDDLPQVPVYIGENYVLFWVQGNISWSYNTSEKRFEHTRNTYSDYGYYLLTDEAGELLTPTAGEEISGTPTDVTTYAHYQVHDYDSLNLIDRSGINGGGRVFYGEQFGANQTRTFTFPTQNADTSDESSVYIEVAAYSTVATNFSATLNNAVTRSVSIRAYPDSYAKACTGTIGKSSSFKSASLTDQQQIKLTLESSIASSVGWLNCIEITTPSYLKMSDCFMPVRTNANYNSPTPIRFNMAGANEKTQIWDVTRLDSIIRVPTTIANDTLQWVGTQADGVHEYVAVNVESTSGTWVKAEVIGSVKKQNLHALNNIDYVIICPEGYESLAEELAKAHEAKQAITWAVVTDQQVYNEFSSGTPDATAYRWLMKMLYDRAEAGIGEKPRWLLLMGHGSFDNRNLLRTASGTKLLLTYQAKNSDYEVNAYCTDDYFAFLDDSEGEYDTSGRMDIGVGRLPVNSLDEARIVVDKCIRYIKNENPGKWKTQLVYVADDGEHGTHTETAEGSAELVRKNNLDFIVNKIYLDAYPQEVNASGESYPLAKNRMTNLLNSGALFFDYSGHGSATGVTNEGILNLKDIEAMTNRNLAFWLFATCSFAECDGGKRSSAEAAVLNKYGAGAIGVLAATRTVYATPNTELNRKVTEALFKHDTPFQYNMTIGEACKEGKNLLGSDANKMAYVLLGDPAIRLNYPTDYQVRTETKIDTLNALSVQKVEGSIIDDNYEVNSDFNGIVDITVYDKMQVIKTRDNDAPNDAKEIAYNDYPNTIFSGSAQVKEGKFEYTFMVPKDIRYNFGNGRIVYYAKTTDSLELAEAVGHYEDFVVGGSSQTIYTDTTGPEMDIYLNCKQSLCKECGDDTTYISNATPRFYADLYDPSGINTAGAGIGHDLMLIVDNDPNKIYSLNEYFTSDSSFVKGHVSYLMSALAAGDHTLTFRAWDLLNNSSTKSLKFKVDLSWDPSICSVTTYPNPVQQSGIINVIVDYAQPEELLEMELYLFNLSGQMVYSFTQNNPDQVSISLSNLGLQPGIYVYNVRAKSMSSKYSASSGKIIVTR